MTNEQAFNDWAAKHGVAVKKSEGAIADLSTVNYGGMLPVKTVEQLIDMTRDQSAWLSAVDTRIRSRMSGSIPIFDFTDPATEGVGENDPTRVTNVPSTRHVDYSTKKFKSEFYITTEDLREGLQSGIDQFEQKMTAGWATQLQNDIATLVMLGDKSLDSSSRLNRLLRMVDGVDKVTGASANVYDAAGKAFDQGVFASMLDFMPEKYSNDPNLRWLFNRRTNISWLNSLTNVNTTERMRSSLGDQALTSQSFVEPLGIPQLLVPQISSTKGASAAPTSVVDGTTFLTIRVATILPDATTQAGRKVKVMYKPTGKTEICTVTYPASQNTIVTVGTLGQTGANSTTASDYVVYVYDTTDLYLMNPKNIVVVYCNEWRSYREFNKNYDRFEVTTYFEADVIIPTPELIVKYKNVKTPAVSW